MIKKKIIFAVAVALILPTIIFTGCGSKSPTPPNPTATSLPNTTSSTTSTSIPVTTTKITSTSTSTTTTQTTQTTTTSTTTSQSTGISQIPLSHLSGGVVKDSQKDCLICHKYPDGINPVPEDHVGRTSDQCQLCHKPAQ